MNFSTWLASWLARHPLQEPPHHNPAWYTAEVMQKVKAAERPARAPVTAPIHVWLSWPRLGLIAAVATSAVVLVTVSARRDSSQLAKAVLRDSQVLDAVDETSIEPVLNGDSETLAQELELHDTMMLAESEPSDEQWIDQTMQLLDQLDQDNAVDSTANDATNSSDDQLLNELRLFDDTELGIRS